MSWRGLLGRLLRVPMHSLVINNSQKKATKVGLHKHAESYLVRVIEIQARNIKNSFFFW